MPGVAGVTAGAVNGFFYLFAQFEPGQAVPVGAQHAVSCAPFLRLVGVIVQVKWLTLAGQIIKCAVLYGALDDFIGRFAEKTHIRISQPLRNGIGGALIAI